MGKLLWIRSVFAHFGKAIVMIANRNHATIWLAGLNLGTASEFSPDGWNSEAVPRIQRFDQPVIRILPSCFGSALSGCAPAGIPFN